MMNAVQGIGPAPQAAAAYKVFGKDWYVITSTQEAAKKLQDLCNSNYITAAIDRIPIGLLATAINPTYDLTLCCKRSYGQQYTSGNEAVLWMQYANCPRIEYARGQEPRQQSPLVQGRLEGYVLVDTQCTQSSTMYHYKRA